MLSFTIHKLGDTTLFRCAGRFVSGDIEDLRDAIRTHCHSRSVVLDLAQIGSIDAAGLGTLVSLRTWAGAAGIGFKLMNLTPRVEEMLELTNLRMAFKVCSVAEMLDLLCHAMRQAPSSTAEIEMPQPLPQNGIAWSATRTGSRN